MITFDKPQVFLLASFGTMMIAFASFLATEEPMKHTLPEWICNISTIATTFVCIVALALFVLDRGLKEVKKGYQHEQNKDRMD